MMQRKYRAFQFSALLATMLLCCLLLTSCGTYFPNYVRFYKELSPKGTIEYDDDDNITYNGTKYIDIANTDGKISTDFDSEHCVKIATMPHNYLLGAVSEFYGDELAAPTIISCNRGDEIWVREGVSIDELIMNNHCIVSDSFSFKICDVITSEVTPFSLELEDKTVELHTFSNVLLEDYPAYSFHVSIVSLDDVLYLQYAWDSDFYKITDGFEADLCTNGFIN